MMDRPGASSRNIAKKSIQESPESPGDPDNGENVYNIPRVGSQIQMGSGLESSSEDEFEEPSAEEESNESPQNHDYGYDDDYIGDDHFTLYTRRDVYCLQGLGPLSGNGVVVMAFFCQIRRSWRG